MFSVHRPLGCLVFLLIDSCRRAAIAARPAATDTTQWSSVADQASTSAATAFRLPPRAARWSSFIAQNETAKESYLARDDTGSEPTTSDDSTTTMDDKDPSDNHGRNSIDFGDTLTKVEISSNPCGPGVAQQIQVNSSDPVAVMSIDWTAVFKQIDYFLKEQETLKSVYVSKSEEMQMKVKQVADPDKFPAIPDSTLVGLLDSACEHAYGKACEERKVSGISDCKGYAACTQMVCGARMNPPDLGSKNHAVTEYARIAKQNLCGNYSVSQAHVINQCNDRISEKINRKGDIEWKLFCSDLCHRFGEEAYRELNSMQFRSRSTITEFTLEIKKTKSQIEKLSGSIMQCQKFRRHLWELSRYLQKSERDYKMQRNHAQKIMLMLLLLQNQIQHAISEESKAILEQKDAEKHLKISQESEKRLKRQVEIIVHQKETIVQRLEMMVQILTTVAADVAAAAAALEVVGKFRMTLALELQSAVELHHMAIADPLRRIIQGCRAEVFHPISQLEAFKRMEKQAETLSGYCEASSKSFHALEQMTILRGDTANLQMKATKTVLEADSELRTVQKVNDVYHGDRVATSRSEMTSRSRAGDESSTHSRHSSEITAHTKHSIRHSSITHSSTSSLAEWDQGVGLDPDVSVTMKSAMTGRIKWMQNQGYCIEALGSESGAVMLSECARDSSDAMKNQKWVIPEPDATAAIRFDANRSLCLVPVDNADKAPSTLGLKLDICGLNQGEVNFAVSGKNGPIKWKGHTSTDTFTGKCMMGAEEENTVDLVISDCSGDNEDKTQKWILPYSVEGCGDDDGPPPDSCPCGTVDLVEGGCKKRVCRSSCQGGAGVWDLKSSIEEYRSAAGREAQGLADICAPEVHGQWKASTQSILSAVTSKQTELKDAMNRFQATMAEFKAEVNEGPQVPEDIAEHAESQCENNPKDWQDSEMRGCEFYDAGCVGGSNAEQVKKSFNPENGFSAAEACCKCGGGLVQVEAEEIAYLRNFIYSFSSIDFYKKYLRFWEIRSEAGHTKLAYFAKMMQVLEDSARVLKYSKSIATKYHLLLREEVGRLEQRLEEFDTMLSKASTTSLHSTTTLDFMRKAYDNMRQRKLKFEREEGELRKQLEQAVASMKAMAQTISAYHEKNVATSSLLQLPIYRRDQGWLRSRYMRDEWWAEHAASSAAPI